MISKYLKKENVHREHLSILRSVETGFGIVQMLRISAFDRSACFLLPICQITVKSIFVRTIRLWL